MKRITLFISIIFLSFQALATTHDSLRIQMDSLLQQNRPLLETTQLSLLVWDLDSDVQVYSLQPRQLLRPASTMKVLTAVTALDRLGADYRFSTRLYTDGITEDGVFRGNIWLKGGMDPSFNEADMHEFVSALGRQHIDSISGSLVSDLSFKDSIPFGKGWCWDDRNPVLSPLLFKKNPQFTAVFRQSLSDLGVSVNATDSLGVVPPHATLLCEQTTPLRQILTRMMKRSDNLYAESMLYQLSAAERKKATAGQSLKQVEEMLKSAGVDSEDYVLADGSGLSLYNYITAEAELRVLKYVYRKRDLFQSLYESLPIAGVDGTLEDRMKNTPAQNNVRAKTGTLSGVSALAGYYQGSDSHTYAFVILHNGIRSSRISRQFQDAIMTLLCR